MYDIGRGRRGSKVIQKAYKYSTVPKHIFAFYLHIPIISKISQTIYIFKALMHQINN